MAGAATGTIGAVLGIGGGVFLVPALILYFGVDITSAAGAGLIAVIATSTAAASVNVPKGTVNIRLGLVLETATVVGALAGGFAAAAIPPKILIGVFGLLLLFISLLLWRDKVTDESPNSRKAQSLEGEYYDEAAKKTVVYGPQRLPIGMAAGFAAGNLSGLLGVGGGVLKVPILHLYCGIPMKAATATSNYMIGITASASAIIYFVRGDIDPALSGGVALGALAGSRLGAQLGGKIDDRNLRRAFAVVTVLLSFQMIRRALGG